MINIPKIMEVANYIVQTQCTVRQAAHHFKMGKSTVHRWMTDESCLPYLNPGLSKEVREVLDTNLSEATGRGGVATQERWRRIKSQGRIL